MSISFMRILLVAATLGTHSLPRSLSNAQWRYGNGARSQAEAEQIPPTINLEKISAEVKLNPATSRRIAWAINDATRFCEAVRQKEYVVDCLGYQYWQLQRQLPTEGDYAEVRVALRKAAEDLEDLADRNRSREKRPARLSQGGDKRTTRAIVPVPTETVSDLADAGATIIEEAQTVLLRSSQNSDRRRQQFQRISQALDSGAILLRSL